MTSDHLLLLVSCMTIVAQRKCAMESLFNFSGYTFAGKAWGVWPTGLAASVMYVRTMWCRGILEKQSSYIQCAGLGHDVMKTNVVMFHMLCNALA